MSEGFWSWLAGGAKKHIPNVFKHIKEGAPQIEFFGGFFAVIVSILMAIRYFFRGGYWYIFIGLIPIFALVSLHGLYRDREELRGV